MILYHFCCEKDARGIRTDGITKGAIPWFDGNVVHMMTGWQWLTLDGDHAHQSWAKRHILRYDRTEYRWTVEIPDDQAARLYDRDRLEQAFPSSYALFAGWLHSDQWRVHHGPIPRRWLTKLERWDPDFWEWIEVWRA